MGLLLERVEVGFSMTEKAAIKQELNKLVHRLFCCVKCKNFVFYTDMQETLLKRKTLQTYRL